MYSVTNSAALVHQGDKCCFADADCSRGNRCVTSSETKLRRACDCDSIKCDELGGKCHDSLNTCYFEDFLVREESKTCGQRTCPRNTICTEGTCLSPCTSILHPYLSCGMGDSPPEYDRTAFFDIFAQNSGEACCACPGYTKKRRGKNGLVVCICPADLKSRHHSVACHCGSDPTKICHGGEMCDEEGNCVCPPGEKFMGKGTCDCHGSQIAHGVRCCAKGEPAAEECVCGMNSWVTYDKDTVKGSWVRQMDRLNTVCMPAHICDAFKENTVCRCGAGEKCEAKDIRTYSERGENWNWVPRSVLAPKRASGVGIAAQCFCMCATDGHTGTEAPCTCGYTGGTCEPGQFCYSRNSESDLLCHTTSLCRARYIAGQQKPASCECTQSPSKFVTCTGENPHCYAEGPDADPACHENPPAEARKTEDAEESKGHGRMPRGNRKTPRIRLAPPKVFSQEGTFDLPVNAWVTYIPPVPSGSDLDPSVKNPDKFKYPRGKVLEVNTRNGMVKVRWTKLEGGKRAHIITTRHVRWLSAQCKIDWLEAQMDWFKATMTWVGGSEYKEYCQAIGGLAGNTDWLDSDYYVCICPHQECDPDFVSSMESWYKRVTSVVKDASYEQFCRSVGGKPRDTDAWLSSNYRCVCDGSGPANAPTSTLPSHGETLEGFARCDEIMPRTLTV